MGSSSSFYLVRHGHYDYERLTTKGREIDATRARDELISLGLGSSAVLLASDAPRAFETAEIIGRGLGVEPVASRLINLAGNSWTVKSLDEVVDSALDAAGVELDQDQELIVVAHAPMLATVRGVDPDKIQYGEVLLYERGTWNNPYA